MNNQHDERILRLQEVMNRTGIARSTIYYKIERGCFPAQLRLGPKMVGWYKSEIDAWIANPR